MATTATETTSTRDRIVTTVRSLIVESGADAVSMRRVATAVGITPMAIYRYFDDRDAMLEEVADNAFVELDQRFNEKSNQKGAPADVRLHELLELHVDFALAQPRLYDFMFTAQRQAARRYPQDFQGGQPERFNALADTVRDGIAQGVLADGEVWEISLLLAAFMHGLIRLYLGGRVDVPRAQFRKLCMSMGERMIDGLRK